MRLGICIGTQNQTLGEKEISEIIFFVAINNIPTPCWSFRAGVLLKRGFSFLLLFSHGLRRPLLVMILALAFVLVPQPTFRQQAQTLWTTFDLKVLGGTMAPRFSLPLKRPRGVHESCGAHASGSGAERIGTTNARREKSLLMNRMAHARTQTSRNGKKIGKRKFEF